MNSIAILVILSLTSVILAASPSESERQYGPWGPMGQAEWGPPQQQWKPQQPQPEWQPEPEPLCPKSKLDTF